MPETPDTKLIIEDGELRGSLVTDWGDMIRWETNPGDDDDQLPEFMVQADTEIGSSIAHMTGEELVEMASGLIQLAGTGPLPAIRYIRDRLNAILEAHGVEL